MYIFQFGIDYIHIYSLQNHPNKQWQITKLIQILKVYCFVAAEFMNGWQILRKRISLLMHDIFNRFGDLVQSVLQMLRKHQISDLVFVDVALLFRNQYDFGRTLFQVFTTIKSNDLKHLVGIKVCGLDLLIQINDVWQNLWFEMRHILAKRSTKRQKWFNKICKCDIDETLTQESRILGYMRTFKLNNYALCRDDIVHAKQNKDEFISTSPNTKKVNGWTTGFFCSKKQKLKK